MGEVFILIGKQSIADVLESVLGREKLFFLILYGQRCIWLS